MSHYENASIHMANSNTPEYRRLKHDTSSISEQSQNNSPTPHRLNLPIKTPTVHYVPNNGWSRYKSAARTLLPFRRKCNDVQAVPVDHVGLFSYITFSWLFSTVNNIDETSIPSISPLDSCDINGQRLQHIWREESLNTGQKGLQILTVIWKFVKTRFIATAIIHTLGMLVSVSGVVLFLTKLLDAIEADAGIGNVEAILWGLGIMLTEIVSAFLLAWSGSLACRTAVRLRSAIASITYKKIVHLSNKNIVSTQQIVSLLGTDGRKLYEAVLHSTHVIVSPIVFTYSIFCSLLILRGKMENFFQYIWISLFPFILTYPMLYVIVKLGSYLSSRGTVLCRQRMSLIYEMLVHIRLVKMTLWENILSEDLKSTRRNELRYQWQQFFWEGVSKLLLNVVPIMSIGVLLFLYVKNYNNMESSEVIPLLALFCGFMRDSLFMFWFGFKKISDAVPSLKRFKMVMLLVDVNSFSEKPINRLMAVTINDANFVWDNVKIQAKKQIKATEIGTALELNKLTDYDETRPVLEDITLLAPKNKLIGICGLSKSGKTSLLLAILGHLHQTRGQVLRNGSLAFVGERPWIWNASVRDNILFKEPFNHKRYYDCLLNCALNETINNLPHQDKTQIDEMSFSPGLKQQIALARALYSNRDIYLLDNPLSLVNADMAATIFEKSILNALRDRTVILATRHVQFLSRCDEIYLLEEGKIVAFGSHEHLLQDSQRYSSIVKNFTRENSKNFIEMNKHCHNSTMSMTSFLNQHIQPSSSIHSIRSYGDEMDGDGIDLNRMGPLAAYVAYLRSASTYILIIVGLVALLIYTSCIFGVSVSIIHESWNMYGVYLITALVPVMFFTGFIWNYIFVKVVIGVSQRTHDSWFEKLCRAPVGYFQATPAVMSVLNLFSLVIHDLDCVLPSSLSQLLNNTIFLLCMVFVIVYISPYCVAVLLVAVTITLFWFARKHRNCTLKLYAMELGSRGPLYQHVCNSVTGRTYIQAFSKVKEFITDFTEKCDDNTTCIYLLSAANQWLAFRVRIIGAVAVGIVAVVGLTDIITWFGKDKNVWIEGITLVIVIQLGQCLCHIVQAGCESEAKLNLFTESSQCIQGIKREGQKTNVVNKNLPANWPTDGSIVFDNVKTKALPPTIQTLNGVSFKITSGQKIGVVGLPGSGEKLIVDALFHLVDLAYGSITIGGTNIKTVPLEKLRSSLVIIPQDPVLFTGTIRLNLDPHELYGDAALWESLAKVQLREKIESLPGKLNAQVDRNGDRLSAGERQLLCLARACLKDIKVLIVEEPLATMNDELESMLNYISRDLFPNATVLTIAHHMKYVTKCDKIMVVESGKVVEFDSPATLYSNRQSYFSRMITASTGNLFETEL